MSLEGAPAGEAGVFAALGDAMRLAMVARLGAQGPLPTIALTAGTGMTRQAVTKHLRVLEEAGLVRSSRVGRDRAWRVEVARLAEARAYLDRISAQWDARVERLRAFVEAGDG